jgi:hypothetical protein
MGAIFHTVALFDRPEDHQQASRSITCCGITQDNPKRLKREYHKAEATSQWRRRWSTDSFVFLHVQHLFITITCRFLRLSKVRIFPRAVGHEKKAALERVWVRHTYFQGNRVPIGRVKEWKKDLTLNRHFLEGIYQSLSSPPLLTITECNIWKKEAKTFTSQSCASLAKLTFHWLELPKSSRLFATEASFATVSFLQSLEQERDVALMLLILALKGI